MNVGTVETQVVQALGGLLVLAVTTALGYLAPKAKSWVSAHTNAKTAATANDAIDGLSKIAEAVVQDFNQRIVSDAKANGVWNAQLAQQIKHDAVQSVMSQGGALVSLASKTVGNVQDLVASQVEQAVARGKWFTPAQISSPISSQEKTQSASDLQTSTPAVS